MSDKLTYDLFHISILVISNALLVPYSVLSFFGLLLIAAHCAFASRFLIECEDKDETSFKTEAYFFLSRVALVFAWLVTIGSMIVRALEVIPYGI